MTRIVQVSDLHFGTEIPAVCAGLLQAIAEINPDLVVVSGDLTQRATNEQFQAAQAFLASLKRPLLIVPGNHDIPLYNLFLRLLRPFHRYCQWITADLAPVWENGKVIVVGLNTADPLRHQKGVFRHLDLSRVESQFQSKHAIRIVVAHHPPMHAAGTEKEPPRHAPEAIQRLAACQTDIILSGHLHKWQASPYPAVKGARGMLQIQAGTALSSRLRGDPNDFNVITVAADAISVVRYAATPDNKFAVESELKIRLENQAWVTVAADTAPTL